MLLPAVKAGIDCVHKCANPACLEGTEINYTISVYNNLPDNIVIDKLYIRDVESDKLLTFDAKNEKIVPSNQTVDFVLQSYVKAPEKGYTIYYVPCFHVKSFNQTSVIGEEDICGKVIKSLTVVPLKNLECRTDQECEKDEYCNTHSLYKCKPLECTHNQSIQNHKCEDMSCNSLQYAKEHQCRYNSASLLGLAIIFLIVVTIGIVAFSRPRKRRRK
jgi:hypothetical protein